MKKIVPFNNVLNFSTDVCEITAISLEHKIAPSQDSISGVFYITGEYKITDGQLEKDKFNFELPFDIALGSSYNLDTLVVDIDDFRYELFDKNKLKVNIDLYIDGEEIINPVTIEDPLPTIDPPVLEDSVREDKDIDLFNELTEESKENNEESNKDDNSIFNDINFEDKFVTYRVYRVLENDSIDKILSKYNITKEELLKYNNNLDIKVGDKLIIPANDK